MSSYSEDFRNLNAKFGPYPYQERVAENLLGRRHIIVRAPTGTGKTLAVLAPFLLRRSELQVGGMIYVLPLRTLVEAVYEEAVQLAESRGVTVALQTGERADAEFFHDADIIVTTFDQLVSGLLCDPYGLSRKLWNINAAAIAGKFVVFDEFHLMEPEKAFASALFGVRLFKEDCLSAWMTATATRPLVDRIKNEIGAEEIPLTDGEQSALFEGRGIRRSLTTHWDDHLTAAEVRKHHGKKTLAVVNTVKRAQQLYDELTYCNPLLLHSRFFSTHRREKQRKLKDAHLIIATQVIEAGVDISSAILLTEQAPVNALVQRAGRCARFKNETGTVHVYGCESPRPYDKAQLAAARRIVTNTAALSPKLCRQWVQEAHAVEDAAALTGFNDLMEKRRQFVLGRITGEGDSGASAFIRTDDNSVRLFILNEPEGTKPQEREAIQVRRRTLTRYASQLWTYCDGEWTRGADLDKAYAVAISPGLAGYTKEAGLRVGNAGNLESPVKAARQRPGWSTLHEELWAPHTLNVMKCAQERLYKEGLSEAFLGLVNWTAKLHDVGKLQQGWQSWAIQIQKLLGKEVKEALAHTDFDWRLHRKDARPPKHASASTLYGADYLNSLSDRERSAILLAVLSHHGGTLKGMERPDSLHANARQALRAIGMQVPEPISHLRFISDQSDNLAVSFEETWPLAAILTRILRMSDQQATSEIPNE